MQTHIPRPWSMQLKLLTKAIVPSSPSLYLKDRA
jgi:hypothetical protein